MERYSATWSKKVNATYSDVASIQITANAFWAIDNICVSESIFSPGTGSKCPTQSTCFPFRGHDASATNILKKGWFCRSISHVSVPDIRLERAHISQNVLGKALMFKHCHAYSKSARQSQRCCRGCWAISPSSRTLPISCEPPCFSTLAIDESQISWSTYLWSMDFCMCVIPQQDCKTQCKWGRNKQKFRV